jgi:hypothetical protein
VSDETSPTSTSTGTTSTSGGSTGTTGGSDDTAAVPGGGTGDDTSDVTAQATIRVNGAPIVVSVGETFPSSDPAFTLVAVDGNVAEIGLVSGSFSNGVQTLHLKVGDTVTLISQPDGARFTLKLIELA